MLAEATAKTAEIEAILAKPDALIKEAELAFQHFIETQDVSDFEQFDKLRREAAALDASVFQLRTAAGALGPIVLRNCASKAIAALQVAAERINAQLAAVDRPERDVAKSLNLDYQASPNITRLTQFKSKLIDEMNAFRNETADRHPGRFRQLANLLPL